MKKVLFLIHDLGQGGAEKVLVNLVNNLDSSLFDITVMSLFAGGVNEQFLKPEIKYLTVFKKMIPGNSRLMKLFTPKQLHKWFIKDNYDIEVSYLEGPSARVISGGSNRKTKLISWIHSNHFSMKEVALPFRSEKEAIICYSKFDRIVCVSNFMNDNFCSWVPVRDKCNVLYNTVESQKIKLLSTETADEIIDDGCVKLIAAGSLKEVKGFDRLLRIVCRLKRNSYSVHLYLLGKGPLRNQLENYVINNHLNDCITFLGYQTNPYKYVSKCDLLVCSSHSEGFSTVTIEALIVGTPVCTVDVSGMKEMLGENNEYGIVTENTEEALYQGIKRLLDNPDLLAHYKKQAEIRGKMFDTENTVKAVEEMLLSL